MKHHQPEFENSFRALFKSKSDPSCIRKVEAFFAPAFHPHARIVIKQYDNFTRVELDTPSYDVWASKKTVKSSDLQIETADISNDVAREFWAQIKEMKSADEMLDGNDGIRIDIRYEDAEGEKRLRTCSPVPKSHEGKIVDLIVKLAWNSMSKLSSIARLEHIAIYLSEKLYAHVIEGMPIRIRFYGSTVIDVQTELEALLKNIMGTIQS